MMIEFFKRYTHKKLQGVSQTNEEMFNNSNAPRVKWKLE